MRRAAALLKRGRLVAFATETVYGLGADAFNAKAVLGVFRAKKRPSFDPLIVHVSNFRQFESVSGALSPLTKKLVRRFWPGPLTIVVPKINRIPDVVTAGLSTVAVRMPAHPCARKLLAAFGGPIAAPSANRFGYTSPTTASDVHEDLAGRIEAVLDGGASPVGIESTIVWPRQKDMILLRPGAVSVEALSKIAPVRMSSDRLVGARGRAPLLSPGGLPTHYAPHTPMALLPRDWTNEIRRLDAFAGPRKVRLGLLLFKECEMNSPHVQAVWALSRKGSLDEAAANLFHAIRNLDKMSLDAILVAPVPQVGMGRAINDRLEKASSGLLAGSEFYETILQRKTHP